MKKLLISYGKTHKPLMTDTVPRWIKDEQSSEGVNIGQNTHSRSSASSNKAKDVVISVLDILKRSHWKGEHV